MIKRKQEMTVEPRFEVKGGRGGYDRGDRGGSSRW